MASPKPGLAYLDTSFYLSFLLGEAFIKPYEPILSSSAYCSSTLLLIETERSLIRLSREKLLDSSQYEIAMARFTKDREHFIFKDVDRTICLTGQYPPVSLPRSSDLVHLRTALWFSQRDRLDHFFSLDEKQNRAAREFRLPVFELKN